MMNDFLPAAAQRLSYSPGDVGWRGWLFFEKETRNVLGTVGVSGPPDEAGGVGMAFSIYESYENQGFTKEAVNAVSDWILSQRGVKSLRMTIR
jgi:RimJ/RimL family protein N-acetyltransferase